MTKYLLPLCAALLLLPATASAAPAGDLNEEGARVDKSGAVTVLEFGDGDNVDGEVLSPNGANIAGRMAKVHKSMITIRGVFTPELIRLANDI